MFSDILNEIAANKKRNSLHDFKFAEINTPNKIGEINEGYSKIGIGNEYKVKIN